MQNNSTSWRQAATVVTTIFKGDFIKPYYEAAQAEGVLDKLQLFVIPDRKTPPELYERCNEYRKKGMKITCPSLSDQEAYLAKVGLSDFIPYDSDNRRNIGFLMAYESGCDFVISIDDDNFCRPNEPFYAEHAIVTADPREIDVVETSSGWFNICTLMEMSSPGAYPRGYPYKYRHKTTEVKRTRKPCRVRMNAGLWLLDPDVDAMSWLTRPINSLSFPGESVCLGRRAWSPINTQNTSLHRDLLPAYYFVRMNYSVGGLAIDRFGDIFSGYFCVACLHHMGDAVRVGSPAADHRRNSHNYMRDATFEMGAIWCIEDLADWVTGVKLQGSTYAETYCSLADGIDEICERMKGFIWTKETRGYFHDLAYCMRRWANTCGKFG